MKCTTCGAEVNRSPSHLKYKNVFCNHTCYAVYKSKKWTEQNNPRWAGGDDKKTCETCGKAFTRKKYGQKLNKNKFCSIKCASKDRGNKQVGENHWNWKGGIGTRHLRRTAPPKPEICEVCNRHHSEFRFGLVLDHDHKTNKFRGWICTNCNSSLGLLKEDIQIIERLKQYLIRNNENLL